jgi:hypothetical protein
MPVFLRKFYAQKLIDAKKKESELIKDVQRGKSQPPSYQKS